MDCSVGGVACIRISTTRAYYKPHTLRHFLPAPIRTYNHSMERKIFWMTFTVLGLLADFLLPLWWALGATFPILYVSWWVAYRSDWF